MQYQGNERRTFRVIPDSGIDPGRALFFSTGYPNYGGTCTQDPSFPQMPLPSTPPLTET